MTATANEPVMILGGGRYLLLQKLGQGGEGTVYLAEDTSLQRRVAVKILHIISEGAARKAERALEEAKNIAALQHPNIVTVFDFVQENSNFHVVMEYIDGLTLQEMAESQPIGSDLLCEMVPQCLEALVAAHSIGMLHRDLKPPNIMLARVASGRHQVKILDFGLAKVLKEPSLQTVDLAGSLLGSVYTMAPEQFDRRPLDARTDLYALGCVFYFALSGNYPFTGETVADIMCSHTSGQHYRIHDWRPDLPVAVADWVESLISREPDLRPPSAVSSLDRWELALSGKTITTSIVPASPVVTEESQVSSNPSPWISPIVWGIAVILVFLAGVVAFWIFQPLAATPLPAQVSIASGSAELFPTEISPLFEAGDTQKLLEQVGNRVRVTGKISGDGINRAGNIRYLNFEGNDRDDLSAVFFINDNPDQFTAPALASWVGREVVLSGEVSLYQNRPQIRVFSFDQLQPSSL